MDADYDATYRLKLVFCDKDMRSPVTILNSLHILNFITLVCLLRRSLTENIAGASFDILHFKTIVILLRKNASEGGDLPTFRILDVGVFIKKLIWPPNNTY